MHTIESERLVLRPFTLQDSDFILELLNTDGWIKYIGDRNVRTQEQAKGYLENGALKSYKINRFGLSLVELRENQKAIGMCGLIKRDYLDHPDIGFAFLPAYHGKGYAHEISKKVIEHGLNQLNAQKILAIVLPENFSSIRLLKKLGFEYEKNFINRDTNEELALYGIGKNGE